MRIHPSQWHVHLARPISLALQFFFPVIVIAALSASIWLRDIDNKRAAHHSAAVACAAARNSDLGLEAGLRKFFDGGGTDPDIQRLLAFLKKNAATVYAGCIRDIH